MLIYITIQALCVIDLEPLSRGQHPLTIYYKPHAFLQTPRVRTMVAGVVFWDHMTYNPHWLPPIEALSIADMLGDDEIFVSGAPDSIPYM